VKEKETAEGFVGQSIPVRKLVETIKVVARTDLTSTLHKKLRNDTSKLRLPL
jgi:transcriptional regulator with GAF, ATPase, and Fis domain